MSPIELAKRHPQIYHVTEPGAWLTIRQNGLLSTSRLLDLFEVDSQEQARIETRRRPLSITLNHPRYGQAVINDNLPLNEKALTTCLDDSLCPSDWLRMLNARVFFWATREGVNRLLNARLNRNRAREVLVVNTLSLAQAHAERIELCPINSGATIRKAARRGINTFTPLLKYSFNEWCTLRGGRDQIREITVLDHVLDIGEHILDVFLVDPGKFLPKG